MKFVFIENRYKTLFWEAVAKKLEEYGHSTGWLIQNHRFSPTQFKQVFSIPYPEKSPQENLDGDSISKGVADSDRNVLYFGGDSAHYSHYAKYINSSLCSMQPDVIVGESTLFHEIMAINWAKENNVPYMHPTSPGYPPGRFVLYQGDTKKAIGGSDETLTDTQCDELVDAIVNRKILPDYMKPVASGLSSAEKNKRNWPKPGSLPVRLSILKSYIKGERYNTPSPVKKVMLDIKQYRNLSAWEKMSTRDIESLGNHRYLLYPMQMQPEANLDVWGHKYRDQTKLIKKMALALPNNVKLLVKPNPKASREINSDLLNFVRCSEKVAVLPLSMPMGDVLPKAEAVVTVTGTVALECVFTGKPVLVLGPSVVRGFPGAIECSSRETLEDSILRLLSGEIDQADSYKCRDLMRLLVKSTYPGVANDPCHDAACMSEANIAQVTNGILHGLETFYEA